MSRIRNLFKKKKKLDNKGEAMILMIVAIGIIMFLGLSLLYATATAFMIRNNERHSEETFNSADTGMDLLKNRLTEVESKAAENGYSQVLNLYSESKYDQVNFKKSFLEGLLHVDVDPTGQIKVNETADTSSKRLFTGTSGKISGYNRDAISYLFKGTTTGADGDTYELNENQTGDGGVVVQASDSSYIILKDLSLKYTRHDGYVTKVTTDIKLKIPQITASMPSQGFEHLILSGFSCVADKGLYLYRRGTPDGSGTSGSIDGSIYAGSVHTRDNALTVTEGHRVVIGRTKVTYEDENGNLYFEKDPVTGKIKTTDGKVTIDPTDYELGQGRDYKSGGGIYVGKDGELWAQDIVLKHYADLTSSDGSTIMVADDLEFNEGGSAKIKGDYIGFGNGSNSDDSSSIVFNDSVGKATIDFSDTNSLMLAGRSFILPKMDTENEIGMGSSITARGEQKAYLIPSGEGGILGEIKNPQTVSKDEVESNKEKVISLVNTALDKNETVYGMATPLKKYYPTVKVLTYPIGDKYKQYYFFSFTSVADANAYFKDFFNASSENSAQIQSYINQYAEINGLKSGIARTAGTGLTTDNGDISITEAISDPTEMENACAKYKKQYENLSETLNKNSSGDSTPFFSMIDVEKLHMTCGYKKSNDIVPVAWWTDHQNLYPVDSADLQHNGDNEGGSNILVVVDKLYSRPNAGGYAMFTYQYDEINKKTNLYKIVCDKITTKPVVGDYVVYNSSDGVQLKIYSSEGSLTTDELQNVICVAKPENVRIIGNNEVGGQAAGYVAWTDDSGSVSLPTNNDLNFVVVDGNATVASAGFHGLIMCSGTIEVPGAKISLDGDSGAKALSKTHIWTGNTGSSKKSSSEDWTLGKMVVYENWKKN